MEKIFLKTMPDSYDFILLIMYNQPILINSLISLICFVVKILDGDR